MILNILVINLLGHNMKKHIFCSLMAMTVLLLTGCSSHSTVSMWENTKTASRHIGRGVRALAGGGKDSRLLHYPYEFQGPEDSQYIGIYDEDEVHQKPSFPLAKEVPGDMGSFLPGIDGFHSPAGKEAVAFKHVHFDTNQDHVHKASELEVIKSICKYLKKNPSTYVYIEGHCDARGTALYNMSLGSRRSNMVRSMLIENGIDLNRLFTVSYGKEKPLDEGNNPVAWEKNRRVQFKLFKKN